MSAKQISQEETNTKVQMKKEKTKLKKKKTAKEPARMKIRLIPIWLRLLLIICFSVISLVFGALIGYSIIGDGNAKDVFKKSTWTHIIDLVKEEK